METNDKNILPLNILRISELDCDTGLANFRDNVEIYLSILEEFVRSGEKNLSELTELLEKKDYENYTLKVHALKCSCIAIGAIQLSEHAKKHELSGKAGNFDFITKDSNSLFNEYADLLNLLGAFSAPSADVDISVKTQLSENDYKGELHKIYQCIDNLEPDGAIETLDLLLKTSIPSDDACTLKEIFELMENFLYDDALEKLGALLASK